MTAVEGDLDPYCSGWSNRAAIGTDRTNVETPFDAGVGLPGLGWSTKSTQKEGSVVQVGLGCAWQGSRDTHCGRLVTVYLCSNESTEVTRPICDTHQSLERTPDAV